MNRTLLVSAVACLSFGAAQGASLNLSYIKSSLGGGMWQYDMTLSVDTSTTGWSPGMGWAWLTFGDSPVSGGSPFNDFVMTSSFPVGPWFGLTFSSGGHNGPTFNSPVVPWVPTASTDTLNWVGKSATNAPTGSLKFSTLIPSGGATAADFKTMTEIVPEPASFLVLGGLVPLFLRKRKARK
jgi:hypothetical protein